MPEVDTGEQGGGSAVGKRRPKRVEVAGAITAEEHRLGLQVLNRETEGIKFNRKEF